MGGDASDRRPFGTKEFKYPDNDGIICDEISTM